MIVIKNKRCKRENIIKEYPGALILDVTSKGEWSKLSPFYPHGGIPIPFSDGATSACVEGIWQGLKVFEHEGIDSNSFHNNTMKDIKRTCRTHGRCLGHQKGINSKELLGYIEARKQIYVPSYIWMLENKCARQVEILRKLLSENRTIIFLDYDTNPNVEDPSKPLSHASLIKKYLENEL